MKYPLLSCPMFPTLIHHTSYFFIDEAALRYGVALYANFALDYLALSRQ